MQRASTQRVLVEVAHRICRSASERYCVVVKGVLFHVIGILGRGDPRRKIKLRKIGFPRMVW